MISVKRSSIPLLLALVLYSATARGAGLDELTVYPLIQRFAWEEYRGDGTRVLRETGPQFGAGSVVRVDLYDRHLMLQGKGEVFGGEVDYSGSSQYDPDNPAVSELPVKTDVGYVGTKVETDIGWRFLPGHGSIEPFSGLGYRWWIRDLQDSVTIDRRGSETTIGGYTEEWQSLYARAGLRGGYTVSDGMRFFAEAAAKYPVLNRNRADFPGTGTVTVKPGKKWSASAEIGARFSRFRASIYYEGFRFSQSPLVPVGFGQYLSQPKSDSDIFGMSFGYCFR